MQTSESITRYQGTLLALLPCLCHLPSFSQQGVWAVGEVEVGQPPLLRKAGCGVCGEVGGYSLWSLPSSMGSMALSDKSQLQKAKDCDAPTSLGRGSPSRCVPHESSPTRCLGPGQPVRASLETRTQTLPTPPLVTCYRQLMTKLCPPSTTGLFATSFRKGTESSQQPWPTLPARSLMQRSGGRFG